ncbi:hypothetical protein GCM10010421_18250 [Streptomyces glaucus]|uniref:Secreted protein n=1 Tax=Streptomyces glaucus TaxID=284029 RepID=A0ABP5WQM3_9ACTN
MGRVLRMMVPSPNEIGERSHKTSSHRCHLRVKTAAAGSVPGRGNEGRTRPARAAAAGGRGAAVGGEPGFPARPTGGFARAERTVQASSVISPKGLVMTLGMVLGDSSSRASTRERPPRLP